MLRTGRAERDQGKVYRYLVCFRNYHRASSGRTHNHPSELQGWPSFPIGATATCSEHSSNASVEIHGSCSFAVYASRGYPMATGRLPARTQYSQRPQPLARETLLSGSIAWLAVRPATGHKRGVWSVDFSPVDKVLVSAAGDASLKVWSVSDFSCLQTFEGHGASVLKVRRRPSRASVSHHLR